ncbi:MAG: DJ-1/PfpI family protein [Deinococcales bacterium]|nr:DJ-1/PfpI family protein [Deinococcales bacterium]
MNVAVLIYHHVSELGVVAPISVMGTAKRLQGSDSELAVFTVARSRLSVQTVSEVILTPTWAFASVPQIDVLFVPGGVGVERARRNNSIIEFLKRTASQASYVVSISSGSLLLGEAGLLRNQNVCGPDYLRERLEAYEVGQNLSVPELRNPSGIWCAATDESSFNLCFALVNELGGSGLAAETAQLMGRMDEGQPI